MQSALCSNCNGRGYMSFDPITSAMVMCPVCTAEKNAEGNKWLHTVVPYDTDKPMVIPKVIHQMWATTNVPEPLTSMMKTWMLFSQNNGWEYKFWTDKMLFDFVQNTYPQYLNIYHRFTNIQRSDFARYMILKHMGGVYVDLDFVILKDIEPILKGQTCVISAERAENLKTCPIEYRFGLVSNAFMASIPQHPFFDDAIGGVLQNAGKTLHESTGNYMLTDRIMATKCKDITIYDCSVLQPLSYDWITHYKEKIAKGGWKDFTYAHDTYAVHFYANSYSTDTFGVNKKA